MSLPLDLATTIGPQGDIFSQHARQGGHIAHLNRAEETREQLPMGVGRGREAWPVRLQMELRPAEGAATGRFALLKHRGDLGKLVAEDLAQQKDRSLERLELLQQHQEGERDRLLQVDTLFWIACFNCLGPLCCLCRLDRLRQPGADILLALADARVGADPYTGA